jgi:pimeloyl-ACP methyl ester carboxylesterase
VRELQVQDAGAEINPISRTRLFLPSGEVGPGFGGGSDPASDPPSGPAPGPRAARVYLCLHGLTNSPQQYVPLAQRLLARGDAAVFIPRIPRHGLADRMTTVLAQLTEAELVDATAEAVDLAAGLADEVVVTGLSMGGVLAAWAAQYRPVARVVVVAPAIGLPFLPSFTASPLAALTLRLGNRFFWWDPRTKAEAPGPTYAYPRYATHALARVQRLGLRLIDVAPTTPPAARSVWMVTNGADLAVSNGLADRLADNWRRSGGSDVHQYEFPRRLRLFHDIVDPEQPYQQVQITHPALERLLVDGEPPDIPADAPAAGAAPAKPA